MAAFGQVFGGFLVHAGQAHIHDHLKAEASAVIAWADADIGGDCGRSRHVNLGLACGKAHGTEVTAGIAGCKKLLRICAFAGATHFSWRGKGYGYPAIIGFAQAFAATTIGCCVSSVSYFHGGSPLG